MGDTDDHHFMGLALAESHTAGAAGNMPVGAVIVRDGTAIGSGHNTVVSERDPTNHAEVAAIRDACRRLGTADLSGATLYTAMEPCPMCFWAIHVAGIRRVVLGGRHANVHRPDLGRYSVETMMAMTGQHLELVTEIRRRECEALWRQWEAGQAAT
jgi:tRNA(Arg) A34 adenosine deaminase TadA